MSDSSPTLPVMPTVAERPEDVTAKVNLGCSEKVPKIEIKLFVGRVPHDVDEEKLWTLFSLFGCVTDVMIMKDKGNSVHKGAAFVRMASIAHADAAIRALNNVFSFEPSSGALQVRYAVGEAEKLRMPLEAATPGVNSAKLFVGSLPRSVTEEEVTQLFRPYGTVEEVYVMKDLATNQGKGCAFVKMAYKEQAHLAVQRLDQSQPLSNTSRPLEVRFAESRRAAHNASNASAFSQQPHFRGEHQPPSGYGHQPHYRQSAAGPSGRNENPRAAGNWKEYFTEEGCAYYYNDKTTETQWERPLEFDRLENLHPHKTGGHGEDTGGGPRLHARPPQQQYHNHHQHHHEDVAGPPGANIFVFHVPNDWTRENLIQVFEPYGCILSARIATDKISQRNKGYAFVSYDNIQSAVDAVNHMDGFQAASNKKLKVAIKQNEESHVAHILAAAAPAKQTAAAAAGNQ